jgi:hypothetical protein
MPPAGGAWLNRATNALIVEKVVLVHAFVDPDRFKTEVTTLRSFLHRLGRETVRGEVCEFEGLLFKIGDRDDGDNDG